MKLRVAQFLRGVQREISPLPQCIHTNVHQRASEKRSDFGQAKSTVSSTRDLNECGRVWRTENERKATAASTTQAVNKPI